MPTSLRRAAVGVLIAPVVAIVSSSAAQQPQLPTFKAGVRLVEVDVVVRDRDDRFVDTLTQDDFEILEGGRPQQIEKLWVVNLPAGRLKEDPSAPVATPLALVGSAVDVGRLYVLVLGGGDLERVKSIAGQFITEFLGPTDLMAVVHVSNGAATQGLTSDRELLLASVEGYRGGGSPQATLGMLKEVTVSLSASTGRRKAVLFIGGGWGLWSPVFMGGPGGGAAVDQGVAALKLTRVFDDVTRTAKRNNVRIYPISPSGWSGGVDLGVRGDAVASLRILAADTGGTSIANTNNYRGNFPHIVRDNSAYYVLTYNSSAEPDGRSHPITVRVRNRPGLEVRQGRQSVTRPTPDVKGRSVRLPKSLSAEARGVLAASAPVDGPAMELFTAVFQAPNYHGSILVGTHVPGALLRLAPKEKIELSYVAVDRWGAVRAVERRAFTLNLGAENRARVEQTGLRLFGRLQVPRGQYQVRVAVHQANGTTASATADVEVPDYMDQPLTVSEFVVTSSHSPTLTTLEEDPLLRGALPAQPTPVRRFARGEALTVFAEIYDSHWIVSQEVGVTMTVAGDDGRLVFRREQVLTTANKGRFNMKGTLPLSSFAPGDYQLLVEVHTRRGIPANTSRQMRFEVLQGDAPAVARSDAMTPLCACATACVPCPAAALSGAPQVQKFEFVSVRRSQQTSTAAAAGSPGTGAAPLKVLPDGRFEARGESLANLTRVAFGFDHVDPNRGVVQAADWMWNDRFDVTASAGQPWTTPPPGTRVPAELRTMLRALLEDRFALQAKIETKKVDVIALRLAKPEKLGPGLRPSAAECRVPFTEASPDEAPPISRCSSTNTRDRIHAEAVTMPEVAQLISQHFLFRGRGLLVDQTGLPGVYDVSFSVPRGMQQPWERFPVELEEQLGLRLKGTSVPLPTLIIEQARKPLED